MSGIEGFAKRFLVPLIDGENCLLSAFAQPSISALLCLIAMRLEFLGGGMRAITTEDHDWLRYYHEPSRDWKIWIAGFAGDRPKERTVAAGKRARQVLVAAIETEQLQLEV